jgi:hypothetical protein
MDAWSLGAALETQLGDLGVLEMSACGAGSSAAWLQGLWQPKGGDVYV